MRYTAEWYNDTDRRTNAVVNWLDAQNFRPATILDFGALTCHQAITLAEIYGSTVTAVDDSTELLDTFAAPSRGTVNVVTHRMKPAEIRKTGPYDVAICFSVLHHIARWRSYLDTITASAAITFVEVPHPDEVLPGIDTHKNTPSIIDELEQRGGQIICQTPGWDPRFARNTYVLQ